MRCRCAVPESASEPSYCHLALVIAIGVDTAGWRHVLGFGLGGSEEYAFWLDFLRFLVERGLRGVQLVEVVQVMRSRWPQAAEILERAEDEILAYMAFPLKYWTRIYSTNPLELLNKEVKRRISVVGVFPNQPYDMRLAGSILLEMDDEWQPAEHRYFSLETRRELTHPEILLEALGPLRLAPIH